VRAAADSHATNCNGASLRPLGRSTGARLGLALVVGTILNLINQGDALLAGGPVDLAKLLLNYVVPYCVSTYGAVSYRFHLARHLPGGDIERPF
jgi:hypothetical protein